MKICVDDLLELKKPHPCGSKIFRALRIGSEIRVVCEGCGRDMVLPRPKLEKTIRRVMPRSIPSDGDKP
ncbi:MAG: DUF951 domain-containing protein [Clostridiales bacterium]|nr:DUF951 domain-containing protein [Clostridiales bacterium]